MPRMAERIAGSFAAVSNKRRSTAGSLSDMGLGHDRNPTTSTLDHHFSDSESDGGLMDIIREANMDGVRHLKTKNNCMRYVWCAVILLFVCLAMIQIWKQFQLYIKHPIATNIEAEYPERIPFPAIAICNNNNFRLTYITSPRIIHRRPKEFTNLRSAMNASSTSVFDTALKKAWDMDAVRFLRNAAHMKSRMILGCTWPNGTSCRLSDFKPVWTVSGLCWAINTDPLNPVEVTGSGAQHGLKLLLNAEVYERINACTPHFKSRSLAGMKVLIYNQTDVPESSADGVNIPPGFSMGIPFRMQHRTKLPGVNCIEETEEHRVARDQFESEMNIRTCIIRRYLGVIETRCGCSMRRAFTFTNNYTNIPSCTVDDYFGCVIEVIRKVQETGSNAMCHPPCQVIDYIAWQDMNKMPQNLMPAVIDDREEEDEDEVEQEDIDEERQLDAYLRQEETFSCRGESYLDEKQVADIKRNAHRAYEKQSRHQEDISMRTKRNVERLRAAINEVIKLKWGWQSSDFRGIYDRLAKGAQCFGTFSERHEDITTIMGNRPPLSEEKRASQVFFLVDPSAHSRQADRFKTIGDVKSIYGDKVEMVLKEIQSVLTTIEKMWALYEEKSYTTHLDADLTRMDKIVSLMAQYEDGRLQRRAWAEKMQSRQMRHFFEDDFYDGYYQPIMKDLDHTLRKTIHELENDDWPLLEKFLNNGTAFKTGAMLFFEQPSEENQTKFRNFLFDVHNCTMGDVKRISELALKDFKRSYRQLHAAYSNLFAKELPDFLEYFEFGPKFVSDNFAMVNIFLHQMHIERWSQDSTYTFWSLACDVGGALGLFLGASLLTIIELVYLCIQHGFCGDWLRDLDLTDCIPCNPKTKKKQNRVRRGTFDPSLSEAIDKTPIESPNRVHPLRKVEPFVHKRSIWGRENHRSPPQAPATQSIPDRRQFALPLEEKPSSYDPYSTTPLSEIHPIYEEMGVEEQEEQPVLRQRLSKSPPFDVSGKEHPAAPLARAEQTPNDLKLPFDKEGSIDEPTEPTSEAEPSEANGPRLFTSGVEKTTVV